MWFGSMPGCTHLKKGDKLICEECGLELKVANSCDCGEDDESCSAETISCCGQDMIVK